MTAKRSLRGCVLAALLAAGVGVSDQPASAVGVPPPTAIAGGGFHSLVLRADGTLSTFGQNFYGQLGTATNNGTVLANPTPTQVLTDVAALAAGQYHSLVLKTDGTLWTFGNNLYGQLGTTTNNGTNNANPTPTQVLTDVAAIAAGSDHSLVLKTDGTLWTFGHNRDGQLGTATNSGTNNANPTPTQVLTDVAAIAAGYFHSLALKTDGTLWTFGDNYFGQLGTATNNGTSNANPTPTQVLTDVAAIAAGSDHSLVLKTDGTLWTFGHNRDGQLGTATNSGTNNANPTPTQVLTDVAAIAAIAAHSLALKTDGTLWTFGNNYYGQLGTATNNGNLHGANPTPTQVLTDVAAIAAGESHSLVLKTDGTLWTFGNNAYGQLGTATTSGSNQNPTPTKVMSGVFPWFFVSTVPGRLLDTREGSSTVDGLFQGIGQRAAGSVTELLVVNRAGIADDATAVTLNVTVVNALTSGFATVFPCGAAVPNTSNINFTAGGTVANLTITQIGVDGKVCIYTSAATHLIADYNGYNPPTTTYTSIMPARLLDTRPGATTVDGLNQGEGVRLAGTTTELQVTDRATILSDAIAAAINITVTGALTGGFVTVYPCGGAVPNASNINFTAGQTIANLTITQIGMAGKICIYTSATTHVIADVTGYNPNGSGYEPQTPARLIDTRPSAATIDGLNQAEGLRTAGSTTELQITGRSGVPTDADAVTINITITSPQSAGYATIYPCGATRPNASNINYTAGQTIANLTITQIGTAGKICIYTSAATHLIADINGHYPN